LLLGRAPRTYGTMQRLLLLAGLCAVASACEHAADSFIVKGPPPRPIPKRPTTPDFLREQEFRAILSASSCESSLRHLTRHAHLAGSLEDFLLADYVQSIFTLDGRADHVFVDDVPALLSFPRTKPRVVARDAQTNGVLFEAALSEDVLPEDATSGSSALRNNTFNGYAPSGKARGRLVYANYGSPQDFAVLAAHNVNVTGAVVITRYGKCFRGLKAMNAEMRGAIGVLIYSDPNEDGAAVGPVYPDGPWRPEGAVQRGSVQFNSLCSGDPARVATGGDTVDKCGYPSASLRPRIPVLPLSARDALPLLKLLGGPRGPETFKGALRECDYRLGPSAARVEMRVDNHTPVRVVRNVVAVYAGEHFGTPRDMPVVLGNHRDAWVFGSADPGSGTAAMLEMVRGFGALKRSGWRPRRTVVVASWSGEELGLLGSTAFVEARLRGALLGRAVAYLNVDVAVAGDMFQVACSPVLATVVRGVLDDVRDPRTGASLASASWDGNVGVLGSGSDFAAFVHYAGVASADLRFSPRAGQGSTSGVAYGTYHSVYDSFDWMARFGDPGFEYHRAMAEVWGLVALRLADAPGDLPLDHAFAARTVQAYVEHVAPQISTQALDRLRAAAQRYSAAAVEFVQHADAEQAVDSVRNVISGLAERLFLHAPGLPRRKWFKHVLQAPALYLGYAADVLPGIQQAYRDEGDAALADAMADVVADKLNAVATWLFGE